MCVHWYLSSIGAGQVSPCSRSPGRVDRCDVTEVIPVSVVYQVYNLTVSYIMTGRRLKQSRINVANSMWIWWSGHDGQIRPLLGRKLNFEFRILLAFLFGRFVTHSRHPFRGLSIMMNIGKNVHSRFTRTYFVMMLLDTMHIRRVFTVQILHNILCKNKNLLKTCLQISTCNKAQSLQRFGMDVIRSKNMPRAKLP